MTHNQLTGDRNGRGFYDEKISTRVVRCSNFRNWTHCCQSGIFQEFISLKKISKFPARSARTAKFKFSEKSQTPSKLIFFEYL